MQHRLVPDNFPDGYFFPIYKDGYKISTLTHLFHGDGDGLHATYLLSTPVNLLC